MRVLVEIGCILGYIISNEGTNVDPMKTKAIRNCHIPLTPINIRSFLALAGYYRRILDRFASIASPLEALTQKKVKFEFL